jgi:cytochrome c peroxidase
VGPTFTDERLHNTGVAWRSSGFAPVAQRFSAALAGLKACATPGCETAVSGAFADLGRAAVTGLDADRGAFKTPTLREVARTAPYMHDGSVATLADVVQFYDEGGRANPGIDPEIHPVHLTADEKRALVAFLRSLSGTIREGASVPGGP